MLSIIGAEIFRAVVSKIAVILDHKQVPSGFSTANGSSTCLLGKDDIGTLKFATNG
ncbi:MAG: hypothetical protein MZV63_04285 [Marinilabiliales bacterium]|nr:hypothetical protein [Marinilabiliales bacterium]